MLEDVTGRQSVLAAAGIEPREPGDRDGFDVRRALGAEAVVGIDLDYEVINNMLMVTASGTAVQVQRV